MRVFFNAVFIQLILSGYIFWFGWQILPKLKAVRIPYIAFFALELIIYFIGYFGSLALPPQAIYYIGWVGTSWMIFVLYSILPLFLYDVLRYLNFKKNKFRIARLNLASRKIRATYFSSVVLLVLGIMAYGSYRFWHPVVTEMNLEVKKESPEIKDLKIAVVADLHTGYLIDKQILSMYVDKIMAQKADMILIVGDIIDYDLKSVEQQNMHEEFKRLQAPYGVYVSTGNHDYIWVDEKTPDDKVQWLIHKAGLNVLRDTVISVNNSIYIAGREDDKFFGKRKPLAEIVEGIDKKRPLIVLNHEPHRLNEEVEAGADIALYGHTHNGQIFPANVLVHFMYELAYGYKKKDNTHIYVTSGLGLAGPQYRIGTLSEIVILNVKFTE